MFIDVNKKNIILLISTVFLLSACATQRGENETGGMVIGGILGGMLGH